MLCGAGYTVITVPLLRRRDVGWEVWRAGIVGRVGSAGSAGGFRVAMEVGTGGKR